MDKKLYWRRTIGTCVLVLLLMPLGHAAMILMEHFLDDDVLHVCAFLMGAAGLMTVIAGVFVKGHTTATIMGLAGGQMFWTGWVEFLFSYYAWRYGVHCDLVGSGIVESVSTYVDGVAVSHDMSINGMDVADMPAGTVKALRGSRPEYLIMPATFGYWIMVVTLYLFCTRTGCRFFTWLQKTLHLDRTVRLRPMTYLPSMVTFLELNVMLWSLYLLLMFCYDPVFLGSGHFVTLAVGAGCLVGSVYMFARQLRVKSLGANIRMSIATVIVFWSFVEIVARNGVLKEIWLEPLENLAEIACMLLAFAALAIPGVLRLRYRRGQAGR